MKTKRKLLVCILAAVLVLTLLPSAALAYEVQAAANTSSSNYSQITVTFSRAVTDLTAQNFSVTVNGSPVSVKSASTSNEGSTYTLTLDKPLPEGAKCSVGFDKGYTFNSIAGKTVSVTGVPGSQTAPYPQVINAVGDVVPAQVSWAGDQYYASAQNGIAAVNTPYGALLGVVDVTASPGSSTGGTIQLPEKPEYTGYDEYAVYEYNSNGTWSYYGQAILANGMLQAYVNNF